MISKVRKKALLVIPNSDVCKRLERQLSLYQWEVQCIDRAVDAIAVIKTAPPSHFALLVCGLSFPVMQGSEFLAQVVERSPLTRRMGGVSGE